MGAFRFLSCVIYTIIENYFCIDYIACKQNQLSDICKDRKYLDLFIKMLGYRHSRFVNELIIVSWFH